MVDELTIFRNKIDSIDLRLLNLLEKRMDISLKIEKYKLKNRIGIRDKKRESEIIKKMCSQTKLNPNFVSSVFNVIFSESKRIQRGLMK